MLCCQSSCLSQVPPSSPSLLSAFQLIGHLIGRNDVSPTQVHKSYVIAQSHVKNVCSLGEAVMTEETNRVQEPVSVYF